MKNTESTKTPTMHPLTPSPPPFMSKSARNRFYAQTSRARHRAHVTNLEKDRELLLNRLEKIEEENRRMRGEIVGLRACIGWGSCIKSYDEMTRGVSDEMTRDMNVDSTNAISDSTMSMNTNIFHTSNAIRTNAQFALSVLALYPPPLASPTPKTMHVPNPIPYLNSPRLLPEPPKTFLVVDGTARMRGQMNWRENWCQMVKSGYLKKLKMCTLDRIIMGNHLNQMKSYIKYTN